MFKASLKYIVNFDPRLYNNLFPKKKKKTEI